MVKSFKALLKVILMYIRSKSNHLADMSTLNKLAI